MIKKICIIICVCLLTTPALAQEQTSQNAVGITFGTGFFQHTELTLTDFQGRTIATSDILVPTNFKASFRYFIVPNFAVQFASGYAFARQEDKSIRNLSQLDSLDVKYINNSKFSMSGFPLETSIIFQAAVDPRNKLLFHVGLGVGYYAYNFKTEGSFREVNTGTNATTSEESYMVPELTLSGWAQFIVMGLNININENIGATFEISKVGLSYVTLREDVARLEIDDGEIENQFIYGVNQRDYNAQRGLDDVSMTLGIYWRL